MKANLDLNKHTLRLNKDKKENNIRENMTAKKGLLEAIAAEVIFRKKCPLWRTRKNAVPGLGRADAEIMFVGEAPGRWEDIQGRPFVGDAGKLFDTLLAETGLSRRDIFICNVLKCRPPKNREPSPVEIQTCTQYLDRQILAIQPKLIVTLGNYSTAYIFSKAALVFKGITQARGRLYSASLLGLQLTVFPTFHPAAALYSAKYKQRIAEDFRLLKQVFQKRRNT